MSKIYTFDQFVFEAKKNTKAHKEMPVKKKTGAKKKSTKAKDQDADGDTDFADVKIAQYTAGGIDKSQAISMSRKFNAEKASARRK